MNFLNFIKLLRPKQWLKNILIFIPIIAAGKINIDDLFTLLNVFIYFSLIVSSTYIFNDLIDIESDKKHPAKYKRPIASGDISINTAKLFSLFLFLTGSLLMFYLDKNTYFFCIVYSIITFSYSLKLKFTKYFDLITIASLFLIRLLIGGVATNISISTPLIMFVLFSSLTIVAGKKISIVTNNKIYDSKIKKFISSEYKKEELISIMQSSAIISVVTYLIWIIFTKSIFIDSFSSLYLIISLVSILFFFFIFINKTNEGGTEEIVEIMFFDKKIFISLFTFSLFFVLGIL